MRVWDWLTANRDWLFSGAGLVVLGILFHPVRAWYQRKRGASDKSNASPAPTMTPVVAPVRPATHRITPREIHDRLDAAPPLQVPVIQRHFEGINVVWRCTLSDAFVRDGDRLRLLLRSGEALNDPSVKCYVSANKYPGLGLLHRGHPITVAGVIREADTHAIELRDVELTFEVAGAAK